MTLHLIRHCPECGHAEPCGCPYGQRQVKRSTSVADDLMSLANEAKRYDNCMALVVHREGRAVELMLDTHSHYNGEWIPGEGADICLYRDIDTGKVMGVRLPLYCDRLSVWHDGELRVNDGFLKDSIQEDASDEQDTQGT